VLVLGNEGGHTLSNWLGSWGLLDRAAGEDIGMRSAVAGVGGEGRPVGEVVMQTSLGAGHIGQSLLLLGQEEGVQRLLPEGSDGLPRSERKDRSLGDGSDLSHKGLAVLLRHDSVMAWLRGVMRSMMRCLVSSMMLGVMRSLVRGSMMRSLVMLGCSNYWLDWSNLLRSSFDCGSGGFMLLRGGMMFCMMFSGLISMMFAMMFSMMLAMVTMVAHSIPQTVHY
jgi:hypothetical protein